MSSSRSTSHGYRKQTNALIPYAGVAVVLGLVCDGWSGKPSPLIHQFALLPFTFVFGALIYRLLRPSRAQQDDSTVPPLAFGWEKGLLVTFELFGVLLVVAEAHHFRKFGYRLNPPAVLVAALVGCSGWIWYGRRHTGAGLMLGVIATYVVGACLSIAEFPLNYLRSDMLPVIGWADQRLLKHLNPYGSMHIGARTYDFPYLPGMLVAYLPAVALHLDLRLLSLAYLLLATGMIWWIARPERASEVALVLGLFLLCPFLQYRHDLYLQPHWFLLILSLVLAQRCRFLWAALVWGLSCAVYQFSWILLPFVLLNAYRRGRLKQAAREVVTAVLGFFLIAAPFFRSAGQRIESNTVGQWSRLPHALADPINVSYWLTYLVRPDQLKWLQAAVLVGLFTYCCLWNRCVTLTDTLRWMCVALAVFIPMNVLVDGYFYLTLLLLLMVYVCIENRWWREPKKAVDAHRYEPGLTA